MCGITIRFGDFAVTKEEVFNNAIKLSHRGTDDGITITEYYGDNKTSYRTMLSFKELVNGDYDTARHKIIVKDWTKEQKKAYADAREKEMSESWDVMGEYAKRIFIHNRLTSYGHTNIENTHPFTEDGIEIYHNGTVYGLDALKLYIEARDGLELEPHTDTRIVLHIFSWLAKKHNLRDSLTDINALDELYQDFCNIVSPFGTCVFVLDKKYVVAFTDGQRPLYFYRNMSSESDEIMLTSEPVILDGDGVTIKVKSGWYVFDMDKVAILKMNADLQLMDEKLNSYTSFPEAPTATHCEACSEEKTFGHLRKIAKDGMRTWYYYCVDCFINEYPIKRNSITVFDLKDALESPRENWDTMPSLHKKRKERKEQARVNFAEYIKTIPMEGNVALDNSYKNVKAEKMIERMWYNSY